MTATEKAAVAAIAANVFGFGGALAGFAWAPFVAFGALVVGALTIPRR